MTDYKALYEQQLAGLQGYKKGYERLKQENKKIKEENEKFKEDIEGDGWVKQGYKTDLSNKNKHARYVFKEMWKLKEENKELKEEMAMWKASYDDEIREAIQRQIEVVMEDNKELEEENNKWLQVARNASCDTPEKFQEYCVRTEKCVSLLTEEAITLEESI